MCFIKIPIDWKIKINFACFRKRRYFIPLTTSQSNIDTEYVRLFGLRGTKGEAICLIYADDVHVFSD